MTAKIDKKIVGYQVKTNVPEPEKLAMHEKVKRPEVLFGSTYKIKTPQSEHALYITINDINLDGVRYPFEIFVNSKNMENFQWVVAMTRVMSATFRKGGDLVFLVEEMKSVFDPKGGYFKRGRYIPSVVAEIGSILEAHLKAVGHIEVDGSTAQYLEEKKAQLGGEIPPNATICGKCGDKAVVVMDGCKTCLSCADSKCG